MKLFKLKVLLLIKFKENIELVKVFLIFLENDVGISSILFIFLKILKGVFINLLSKVLKKFKTKLDKFGKKIKRVGKRSKIEFFSIKLKSSFFSIKLKSLFFSIKLKSSEEDVDRKDVN